MKICNLTLKILLFVIVIALFSTACSRDNNNEGTEASSETETGEMIEDRGSDGRWQQKVFVIGAYDGLRMTGDQETDMKALKTFSDAGFNVMVGTHYWYTSRYFDIRGKDLVSNKYILELTAAFNEIYGKNKVRLITYERNICNDKIPVNAAYSEDKLRDYLDLPQELRDCLYGYNLIDEPEPKKLKASLKAIKSLTEIDSEKMVYVNLGDTGDEFRNCAKDLAENSSILSFDNYHWGSSTLKPTRNVSGVFFKYAQIIAEEARNANIPWWGVPMCVEHEKRDENMKIMWGYRLHDEDNRKPKQELARIRFNAYANIIYGAKGITWYSYDTSNCPVTNPDRIEPFKDKYIPYSFHDGCLDYDGNPSIFYDYVKEVNTKLISMGPTLMDLSWLTTVHGMSYNNYENVPKGSLPIVEEDTPVIASMSRDSTLAVGIFEGADQNKYLIVLNKDIDRDISYTIDLKNAKEVSRFNSSTKEWEEKELTDSGSVSVDVETGDIELLRIIEN